MSAHVGILFSEEMFDWRDSVVKSIRDNSKERITFSTSTDEEYADKRDILDNEWSSAVVLIIMVSPSFLRVLKSKTISFPSFPLKTKVYFLFCGVEADCLEKNDLRSLFYNYESIEKHHHTKVEKLVESVLQALLGSDLNHPDFSKDQAKLQQSFRRADVKKFELIPKHILTENKPMTAIVTFVDDVSVSDDVSFEMEGVCTKKRLRHERLSPNVFRISLPKEIVPGPGKILLLHNNKRMASQTFTIHSLETQTRLFNILDSILSFAGKQAINLEGLDKIISNEISTESNRKADVLDKNEKQDPPTLAQLATKYNLRESSSALSAMDRKRLQRRSVQSSSINKHSSKNVDCVSTFPEHQRELIEILNKVKVGEITVGDAEDLVKYWNMKHGSHCKLERGQSKLNQMTDKGKKISVPTMPKVDEIIDRETCNSKLISSLEKQLSSSPRRKFSLPEDRKEGFLSRQSIPNVYTNSHQQRPPLLPNKPRGSQVSTPPTYANSSTVDAITCPANQEPPMAMYLAMDNVKFSDSYYELDVSTAPPKVEPDVDTYDLDICRNYINLPKNPHPASGKPLPVPMKKPIPNKRTPKFSK